MGGQKQKQHMVLFPFMAQGHITPFLSLAELLQFQYPDLTITLVNTPANIRALQSSLSPNSSIQLQSLPFTPTDHGLPADAEITAALPFIHFVTLFHASETLRPAFEQLLSDIIQADGHSHLCIIADMFFGWTVDVARMFGAFHAVFFTSGAYGITVFMSLWTHLPHTRTTSDEFPLPDFPNVRIHRSQLPKHLQDADGTDRWSIFIQRQISCWFRSDSMLVNTVEGFEATGLGMLRKAAAGIPVWPIGPLLRPPEANSSQLHFVEWLDLHPPTSVIYISFGSQSSITAPQMMELAMGIEASGWPFIWVVRPPVGFDVKGEFRPEWLPDGFEERMGKRRVGMVVHGWGPQVEILRHPSTGAFISHCGWNSVLESLSHGVPIIGWPLSGDQPYNSKMLEDVGLCMEVARWNTESSMMGRRDVERVVGVVMGDTEKGREMRTRAVEVAELLRAALRKEIDGGGGDMGSSARRLNDFLQAAFSRRRAV